MIADKSGYWKFIKNLRYLRICLNDEVQMLHNIYI